MAQPARRTVFSPCGRFRYTLWRTLDAARSGYALVVALNPSTADALRDDPTIRRCIRFARGWGVGALCVANLFALRETDPRRLLAAADPVGPANDRWLRRLARDANLIVAAWGVHGAHLGRAPAVRAMLAPARFFSLGITRHGHPRHPLYLAATTRLQPWPAGEGDGSHSRAVSPSPRAGPR